MTDPNTSTSPQDAQAEVKLKPGDVLAQRYELIQQIGSGGYSTVFAATDRHSGNQLAIKILKTGGGNNDPSALARLRQEANLLQTIDHPHVLKIFAFERYQDLAYVTMEHIPGISLAHIIYRQGAAPSERVLPIVKQLLAALHAVHSQQILHRDIKPENILISPGPPESCKLVDFGLSKAYVETNLAADKLKVTLVKTKAGGFLGTPRYTPPEQALGDEVGPYTDLFSLGLVIAEWLTGEVRLKGDTHTELMRNLVGPHTIDVSDCPRAWQKWLAMILAKDPARRFRSAQQALTALVSEVEAEIFDKRAEEFAMDVPDGFFPSSESSTTSFLEEDGPLELDLERVQQHEAQKPTPFAPPAHDTFPAAAPLGAQPPVTPQSPFAPPPASLTPGHFASQEPLPSRHEPEETSISAYILASIIGGGIAIVIVLILLLLR